MLERQQVMYPHACGHCIKIRKTATELEPTIYLYRAPIPNAGCLTFR